MRKRDFPSADKLIQVLLSILTGCQTLSEVNGRLKPELGLASVWGWERFADQSSLSRTLDALTLKNIEQLRGSTTLIWRTAQPDPGTRLAQLSVVRLRSIRFTLQSAG